MSRLPSPALLLSMLVLAACGRDRPASDTRAVATASESAIRPYSGDAAGSALMKAAPAMTPAPRAPASGAVGAVGGATSSQVVNAAPQLPGAEALPSAGSGQAPASMLVRTGNASVRVDSLGAGVDAVRQLARRVNALVANTSVSAGAEQVKSASIELRIPGERFDELVSGLAPIGTLESVNVQVDDVGEEYTDVAARVANARRLEARLVELLANRTGRLSDVLAVERELARVREEIERYEGRMRYLRTRVAYSTLTVYVHERPPVVTPPGAHPIREGFRQAWRNFVALTAALIASLGVLVPVGGVVGLGWWVMRGRRRPAVVAKA